MKISEIEKNKYKICGRTTECLDPLCLVWTGSSVEFLVRASEFKILIEGPFETYENWIAIEINGEVISRRMVLCEKEWVTVFRMMNPANPVKVRIIKEVQAFESDKEHRLNIYEVETDGELLSVDSARMKIEFIGDSINSAEGCIGAQCEQDWIAQFFSHTRSYPYMVGKALGADIQVISQSGWGVYTSWDCNCNNVIPKYYEGICSLMPKGFFDAHGFHDKWNFSKWQPDVIIINLGTNDDAAFNNCDCENSDLVQMDGEAYRESDRLKVRDAMVEFLKMVRLNNPDADIFWAFGILGDRMAPTIREAIENYRSDSGDDRVGYIELPNTKDDEFGSRSHPGKKAHENAAENIINIIER